MRYWITIVGLLAASACGAAERPDWAGRDLRAGIIGTDTSHVPAFTGLFHERPEWRVKVVAAFKGGSPDLPISANRVEKFAATIRDRYGVQIVDSIDALLEKVDVVLLESVDGRPHVAQARPVFAAGKRLFIDKPLAASLEDARRIVRLWRQTGTPFFSCSSYRFHPDIPRLRERPGVGRVTKVQASSSVSRLEFHPDLFFYGVHGVEALYAVMGRGCVSVSRRITEEADITTGKWKDGREGVFYGVIKGERPPAIVVWGTEGKTASSGRGGYEGLVRAMAEFFHTGRPPVDPEETLEIFEFMTAAQLSSERGGVEVRLEELRR
ncbi:MAG TPA: Gfo/Idh/MocA family oxidoreductase [Planctomycetaceae bacterium]|nr:Gfo/Idh/MocA family oxidoreductase [Planctomycetaceae bacterium]